MPCARVALADVPAAPVGLIAGRRLPVVVTRPADEAGPWLKGLQDQGFAPLALPLLDVVGLTEVPVPPLDGLDALMWVSGNAVRCLMPSLIAHWPPHLRSWAPGPGTAQALRQAGLAGTLIDEPAADAPQFDSEALWSVVAPQMAPGKRLLLVRGRSQAAGGPSSGREWLLQQCEAAGAQVDAVAVYERRCAVWSPQQMASAVVAAQDGSVWLFSSGEAVGHLRALLPGQDWSRTPAVATHPRIASALVAAGFTDVCTARPTLAAVSEALSARAPA